MYVYFLGCIFVYHILNPLNAKKIVAADFLVARSLFSSKRSVGSVRAQNRLATLSQCSNALFKSE